MTSRDFLCTRCGAQPHTPHRAPAGSLWVGLILAVPFVIPGLAYLAWRYSCPRTLCPTCGHATLIPGDAPLARTWRTLGWIDARPADPATGTTSPGIRLDRIEQAVDAIAVEVERISHAQRLAAQLNSEREAPRLRERGQLTPT